MWLEDDPFGFRHSLPMDAVNTIIEIVESGSDLSASQALQAANFLADAEVSVEVKERLLIALSDKGESALEVSSFAARFRELAVDPGMDSWAAEAIDVVGTGGDGAGTFNISTAVSFLLAASGVKVLKHGNRSITSKCGSADILEAVGIRLDAPIEVLQKSVQELNYCFFFAPAFHPAFKEIMPVRKALAAKGRKSIFNLLGPLINPGQPAYQLMGVYAQEWVKPLAEALGQLGLKSGLVVHGRPLPEQALDELSCAGQNYVAGFGALKDFGSQLSAADAGLQACDFSELNGGDAAENLRMMHAFASGAEDALPSGLRDTILLNAAAGLMIVGRVDSLSAGVAAAEETLKSGAVAEWLGRVREFYLAHGE